MSEVYSELPSKYQGELTVAKHLVNLPDDKLHLWFGLENLPGVRDVDILAIHENAGAFIIEVKAVPLNMIEGISHTSCTIEGRSPTITPHAQAYKAMLSLKNFLAPKVLNKRLPYFTATACWPKIERSAWVKHWDNEEICKLSESMLFKDDIFSTPETLTSRLIKIYQKPPMRAGPAGASKPIDRRMISDIARCLTGESRPRPTMSDQARLKAIEQNISRDIERNYPLGESKKTVFSGHPGTGKTFRLLQIGFSHIYQGGDVVFGCFNKTLAADIKRLINFSSRLKNAKNNFEVFDIFDLAALYGALMGLSGNESSHDDWGELIVSELKKGEILPTCKYDTILIDEVQDMKEWHLELLMLHAKSDATICLALGKGQELYGSGPRSRDWIDKFLKDGAKRSRLNRNFRNTKNGFALATCFYQAYPEVARIAPNLKKLLPANNELTFDREEGSLPHIKFFDESSLPSINDPLFGEYQKEIMVKECIRVIKEEHEDLSENDMAIDLLLLVPDTKGVMTEWVRSALDQFKNETGIAYTDYVLEKNRRDIAPNENIRLATYHSSRGIEGTRVVIFNFDKLPYLSADETMCEEKLAYVVLSRAVFQTCIVMRPNVTNKVTKFLYSAHGAIERMS
jgi:hypothetical protein